MGFIYKPLVGIVLNGVVLYLLIRVVDGISYTGGFKFFVLAGIVLGLINFFVKPLLKVLSLPFVLFTGGLFLVLINVFVLWFLSYFLSVAEFRDVTLVFENFQTYVIGAIVFGVINWGANLINS
ncbi:phage holin family protein [Candidatus Peregrinibacteria bacterium]|nr:phage holin family protein [Candidatus Peregrinibacteria bacterium]